MHVGCPSFASERWSQGDHSSSPILQAARLVLEAPCGAQEPHAMHRSQTMRPPDFFHQRALTRRPCPPATGLPQTQN